MIRKVAEKTGGIKEERIYLGSYEIYRKFVSGSLTIERTTVHISDDTGRIAMLEERTVGSDAAPASLQRYIYSNHLQSASLELDENADIISYEEYHPFGTTAYQASNSAINALAKRYRYTGKERDEETGLYYHGARYYIPWLAVWTAIDPLEADYAGMSPYNYSFNNPVMLNDPSGAEPQQQGSPQYNSDQNGSNLVFSGSGMKVWGDLRFEIDLGFLRPGNKQNGGGSGGSGGGGNKKAPDKKAPDKKAPDKKKAAPAPPSSPGGGNGRSGGSPGGTPPPSLINFNIRQVTPIDKLRRNVVIQTPLISNGNELIAREIKKENVQTFAKSEFGNLLAKFESNNNYNIANKTKGGLSVVKNLTLTNMTVGEIMNMQKDRDVFAVGRYQLIPITLKDAVSKLKIDKNELFNEKLQDRIFNEFLIKIKRPEISNYLNGGGDLEKAMYSTAQEWASVGVQRGKKISKGRIAQGGESYYSGDGLNRAHISPAQIRQALINSRR